MTLFMFVLLLCFWSISGQDVRIIDGQIASNAQFPFAVAFYYQTAQGLNFCGGSLINDKWILTAAHCLVDAVGFTVHLGINKLDESSAGTTISSNIYVIHPDYNPNGLRSDIGLISLQTPVAFSDTIRPVELPTQYLGPNEQTVALGWGSIQDEQHLPSNSLNHVNLTTIPNAICRRTYGDYIHENMVCATGVRNQGVCDGDSGGPLIQIQNGRIVQVGIVSFYSGAGCETVHPSGFTRTFEYLEWISNVTRSSSDPIRAVNAILLFAFVLFNI